MKQLQVAVIGCGGIAQVHMQWIKDTSYLTLCAVCDIVPERAKQAAKLFGGDVYTDYQEMLKRDDIDVVHICTPHVLHAPMAIHALQAGKRVLTEKPMASEIAAAQEMIQASDGRLGVVFQNRYNPSSIIAKNIIDDAPMGKLLSLRGMVTWHRTPAYYTDSGWRGSWETEGGGVLINQAIHTIDLMLWFGGAVKRVSGSVSTDALDGIIEVEDTAHFTMHYQDGKRGIFYATTAHSIDSPIEIELTFEEGSLLLRGDTLLQRRATGELVLYEPKEQVQGEKAYWGTGHAALLEDYYDCVQGDRPFWIDGEEGLPALLVLKSVYRSSKERRPVEIEEWRK